MESLTNDQLLQHLKEIGGSVLRMKVYLIFEM